METVWQTLEGTFSEEKKKMKRMKKWFQRICLYYGVTDVNSSFRSGLFSFNTNPPFNMSPKIVNNLS